MLKMRWEIWFLHHSDLFASLLIFSSVTATDGTVCKCMIKVILGTFFLSVLAVVSNPF